MNSLSESLSDYFYIDRTEAQVDEEQLNNTPNCSYAMGTNHLLAPSHNNCDFRKAQSAASPTFSEKSYSSSPVPQNHWLSSPHSLISPHYSDSGYSTVSTPSSSLSSHGSTKCYKKFGVYIPQDNLPVDGTLVRRATNGKSTTWFFLLQLLVDPTKKSVIAWTGYGMEFRIYDHLILTALWNRDNRSPRKTSWDTLKRNIRGNYEKRILRPTNAKSNMFAFVTEPSVHIGMTRKLLNIYIALNNINGPLTIGSPIEFPLPASFFPRGNGLQVNRPVKLREDGSPEVDYEPEYIYYTLFEEDEAINTPLTEFSSPLLPCDSLLNIPYNNPASRVDPHLSDLKTNRYRPY